MKEFQDGRLFVRTPHNPPLCGEGFDDKLAASFDLSYWKPRLARMLEIWWTEPRLEEIGCVAGESVFYSSLGFFAPSAHAMVFDLAWHIDTAVGLSQLTDFFVAGIIGYPSVAAIPDDVFEERFRNALETTTLRGLSARFGLAHPDSASDLIARGKRSAESNRDMARQAASIEQALGLNPESDPQALSLFSIHGFGDHRGV